MTSLGKTSGQRKYLRYLARIGYAARGIVYVLTGLLAAVTAAGFGRETDDTQGALALVHRSPFGDVLLVILAVGLLAYAIWSFLRATFDPEGETRKPRGWMRRMSLFFTSVFYCGLVVLTARTVRGTVGHHEGERSARHWTATLMAFPLGRWAVAGVGIGFLVYVAAEFIRSRRPLANDRLNIPIHTRRWVHWMIQFGIVSRAIVFAIVGLFLLIAAISLNAHRAQGLDGALRALSRQPAGRWLLAFVAAGFVAYGAYDLILARWRVIEFRKTRKR